MIVANQYFIRVDIGHALHSDGYTYCRAEQLVCADTGCVSTAAECDAHTGRGRGLIPQIRADFPALQGWLETTGQLLPIVSP